MVDKCHKHDMNTTVPAPARYRKLRASSDVANTSFGRRNPRCRSQDVCASSGLIRARQCPSCFTRAGSCGCGFARCGGWNESWGDWCSRCSIKGMARYCDCAWLSGIGYCPFATGGIRPGFNRGIFGVHRHHPAGMFSSKQLGYEFPADRDSPLLGNSNPGEAYIMPARSPHVRMWPVCSLPPFRLLTLQKVINLVFHQSSTGFS